MSIGSEPPIRPGGDLPDIKRDDTVPPLGTPAAGAGAPTTSEEKTALAASQRPTTTAPSIHIPFTAKATLIIGSAWRAGLRLFPKKEKTQLTQTMEKIMNLINAPAPGKGKAKTAAAGTTTADLHLLSPADKKALLDLVAEMQKDMSELEKTVSETSITDVMKKSITLGKPTFISYAEIGAHYKTRLERLAQQKEEKAIEAKGKAEEEGKPLIGRIRPGASALTLKTLSKDIGAILDKNLKALDDKGDKDVRECKALAANILKQLKKTRIIEDRSTQKTKREDSMAITAALQGAIKDRDLLMSKLRRLKHSNPKKHQEIVEKIYVPLNKELSDARLQREILSIAQTAVVHLFEETKEYGKTGGAKRLEKMRGEATLLMTDPELMKKLKDKEFKISHETEIVVTHTASDIKEDITGIRGLTAEYGHLTANLLEMFRESDDIANPEEFVACKELAKEVCENLAAAAKAKSRGTDFSELALKSREGFLRLQTKIDVLKKATQLKPPSAYDKMVYDRVMKEIYQPLEKTLLAFHKGSVHDPETLIKMSFLPLTSNERELYRSLLSTSTRGGVERVIYRPQGFFDKLLRREPPAALREPTKLFNSLLADALTRFDTRSAFRELGKVHRLETRLGLAGVRLAHLDKPVALTYHDKYADIAEASSHVSTVYDVSKDFSRTPPSKKVLEAGPLDVFTEETALTRALRLTPHSKEIAEGLGWTPTPLAAARLIKSKMALERLLVRLQARKEKLDEQLENSGTVPLDEMFYSDYAMVAHAVKQTGGALKEIDIAESRATRTLEDALKLTKEDEAMIEAGIKRPADYGDTITVERYQTAIQKLAAESSLGNVESRERLKQLITSLERNCPNLLRRIKEHRPTVEVTLQYPSGPFKQPITIDPRISEIIAKAKEVTEGPVVDHLKFVTLELIDTHGKLRELYEDKNAAHNVVGDREKIVKAYQAGNIDSVKTLVKAHLLVREGIYQEDLFLREMRQDPDASRAIDEALDMLRREVTEPVARTNVQIARAFMDLANKCESQISNAVRQIASFDKQVVTKAATREQLETRRELVLMAEDGLKQLEEIAANSAETPEGKEFRAAVMAKYNLQLQAFERVQFGAIRTPIQAQSYIDLVNSFESQVKDSLEQVNILDEQIAAKTATPNQISGRPVLLGVAWKALQNLKDTVAQLPIETATGQGLYSAIMRKYATQLEAYNKVLHPPGLPQPQVRNDAFFIAAREAAEGLRTAITNLEGVGRFHTSGVAARYMSDAAVTPDEIAKHIHGIKAAGKVLEAEIMRLEEELPKTNLSDRAAALKELEGLRAEFRTITERHNKYIDIAYPIDRGLLRRVESAKTPGDFARLSVEFETKDMLKEIVGQLAARASTYLSAESRSEAAFRAALFLNRVQIILPVNDLADIEKAVKGITSEYRPSLSHNETAMVRDLNQQALQATMTGTLTPEALDAFNTRDAKLVQKYRDLFIKLYANARTEAEQKQFINLTFYLQTNHPTFLAKMLEDPLLSSMLAKGLNKEGEELNLTTRQIAVFVNLQRAIVDRGLTLQNVDVPDSLEQAIKHLTVLEKLSIDKPTTENLEAYKQMSQLYYELNRRHGLTDLSTTHVEILQILRNSPDEGTHFATTKIMALPGGQEALVNLEKILAARVRAPATFEERIANLTDLKRLYQAYPKLLPKLPEFPVTKIHPANAAILAAIEVQTDRSPKTVGEAFATTMRTRVDASLAEKLKSDREFLDHLNNVYLHHPDLIEVYEKGYGTEINLRLVQIGTDSSSPLSILARQVAIRRQMNVALKTNAFTPVFIEEIQRQFTRLREEEAKAMVSAAAAMTTTGTSLARPAPAELFATSTDLLEETFTRELERTDQWTLKPLDTRVLANIKANLAVVRELTDRIKYGDKSPKTANELQKAQRKAADYLKSNEQNVANLLHLFESRAMYGYSTLAAGDELRLGADIHELTDQLDAADRLVGAKQKWTSREAFKGVKGLHEAFMKTVKDLGKTPFTLALAAEFTLREMEAPFLRLCEKTQIDPIDPKLSPKELMETERIWRTLNEIQVKLQAAMKISEENDPHLPYLEAAQARIDQWRAKLPMEFRYRDHGTAAVAARAAATTEPKLEDSGESKRMGSEVDSKRGEERVSGLGLGETALRNLNYSAIVEARSNRRLLDNHLVELSRTDDSDQITLLMSSIETDKQTIREEMTRLSREGFNIEPYRQIVGFDEDGNRYGSEPFTTDAQAFELEGPETPREVPPTEPRGTETAPSTSSSSSSSAPSATAAATSPPLPTQPPVTAMAPPRMPGTVHRPTSEPASEFERKTKGKPELTPGLGLEPARAAPTRASAVLSFRPGSPAQMTEYYNKTILETNTNPDIIPKRILDLEKMRTSYGETADESMIAILQQTIDTLKAKKKKLESSLIPTAEVHKAEFDAKIKAISIEKDGKMQADLRTAYKQQRQQVLEDLRRIGAAGFNIQPSLEILGFDLEGNAIGETKEAREGQLIKAAQSVKAWTDWFVANSGRADEKELEERTREFEALKQNALAELNFYHEMGFDVIPSLNILGFDLEGNTLVRAPTSPPTTAPSTADAATEAAARAIDEKNWPKIEANIKANPNLIPTAIRSFKEFLSSGASEASAMATQWGIARLEAMKTAEEQRLKVWATTQKASMDEILARITRSPAGQDKTDASNEYLDLRNQTKSELQKKGSEGFDISQSAAILGLVSRDLGPELGGEILIYEADITPPVTPYQST